MRDFRDAKLMAHALRDALKAKAVETTHCESLELIAKAFGYANWNVLAAKIDADALLLVLRQEPARRAQADRWAVGFHLRRMRRAVRGHRRPGGSAGILS